MSDESEQPLTVEEVATPENFSKPYVLAAMKDMPSDYLVSVHGVPTIKWGGLQYLLHCFGQPIFKTTDISEDSQKTGPIDESDTDYCIRYEAELRFIPNITYLTALGLPNTEFGRLTGTLMQYPSTAQGSATISNVRTANMAKFARELAETRAKCRAARDFLGVGLCSTEEMGKEGESSEDSSDYSGERTSGGSIKGMASRESSRPVESASVPESREDRMKFIRSRQRDISCLDSTIAFLREKGKNLLDQLPDDDVKTLYEKLQQM